MDNEIIFGGKSYKVITDDTGRVEIMRLNEKYGMWVKISFSSIPSENNADDYIIEVLSNQYIQRSA